MSKIKKAQAASNNGKTTGSNYGKLYRRPLPATRTGALFCAFPYPTKISPEAIALFIAAHTKPGDTVFDGFAGSGTTGLAALLCGNPTDKMRDEANRLGLNVTWGARNAVLYEISALGSFVARTLTNPPNPRKFRKAAEEILREATDSLDWLYDAVDPQGRKGTIRHIIWADVLKCPECRQKTSLWEACVSLGPASISSVFECPRCGHKAALDSIERVCGTKRDDILKSRCATRMRVPVRIDGATGTKRWNRPVTKADLALIKRISHEPIPKSVPRQRIPWGDLYRSGYHHGISHVHHFYTRRNLIVFARLWEIAKRYDGPMRSALQFWLLSYNASHGTIMTRVVAKAGQKDLIVTSAQPGVLYVSGLPVEKNFFAGLRRKLGTITKAFETIYGNSGSVDVRHASSCKVKLPDNSIDYVFTDPPFGGNIPYAEVNFINEAWLGTITDRTEEAIVSRDQRKSIANYKSLLTAALSEAFRVMKKKSSATLVFHSASAEVWNALKSAYGDAGFAVECASVLEKTQGSFKQVTTDGAVRGDPLLLLSKSDARTAASIHCVWQVADTLHRQAFRSSSPEEVTPQRLYSRLVNHYLARDQEVPLDAHAFYSWLRSRRSTEVVALADAR